jgi:hypothetical protein
MAFIHTKKLKIFCNNKCGRQNKILLIHPSVIFVYICTFIQLADVSLTMKTKQNQRLDKLKEKN